ncbi:hypothetical protein D3C86_1592400 [compost metagenome]
MPHAFWSLPVYWYSKGTSICWRFTVWLRRSVAVAGALTATPAPFPLPEEEARSFAAAAAAVAAAFESEILLLMKRAPSIKTVARFYMPSPNLNLDGSARYSEFQEIFLCSVVSSPAK